MGKSQQEQRSARSWSDARRDIWRDGWLVLGLAVTLLLGALFVVVSWNIIGAIIAEDRVFFAGLSATLAVSAAQWSVVRYRKIRAEQASSKQLILTTEDPVLIDAMRERIATEIDNLDVTARSDGDRVLDAALLRWHDRLLRSFSIFRELAVLRRNLDAAYERANEYFDAQAEDEEFHTDSDQFHVIIRDINQACGNALRIDTALRDGHRVRPSEDHGLASMKLNALGGILRDLAEALERRNHVYENVFRYANGDERVGRSREFFRVMTSDLRKAHRTLESLFDRDRFNARIDEFVTQDRLAPDLAGKRLIRQQYLTVLSYTHAAQLRIAESRDALTEGDGAREIQPTFRVLVRDIESAVALLKRNEVVLAREIGYEEWAREAEQAAEREESARSSGHAAEAWDVERSRGQAQVLGDASNRAQENRV
jgi:hypothetical protein